MAAYCVGDDGSGVRVIGSVSTTTRGTDSGTGSGLAQWAGQSRTARTAPSPLSPHRATHIICTPTQRRASAFNAFCLYYHQNTSCIKVIVTPHHYCRGRRVNPNAQRGYLISTVAAVV